MASLDDVLARHGTPFWRRQARVIVTVLVLLFLWSLFAQVDQVVTAPGKVIPHNKVKVIQHLEGGIIKKLEVHENSIVKAGEPLLELDLATGGINKGEMAARLASLRASKLRLEAESGGKPFHIPEAEFKDHPAIVEAESATYRARVNELNSSIDVINGQIAQNRQRVAELEAKLQSLERSMGIAQQELAVSTELVKDKLTSQLEHFQRRSAVERLQGDIAMTRQAIPGARGALEESMARRREEEGKFKRRAADELNEVQRKLASLQQEFGRATDQENRAVVRSPIDGVVKNVRYTSAGNVVKAGEPIMEIVPLKEELVVEVSLDPKYRGYVSKDQEAYVKITAFDYVRYGGLDGKVTSVAADTDVGKDDTHFYRVMVATDHGYLGDDPKELRITPGMQAEVDIHVESRSVFWLLLKPVLKLKHESFRQA
ncbi:MAG TPA: HlyD family type I secretion periplasmic adaptor subunit [Noviherbaspirillum sp.]|nr:HlyD family type I secretion periplasmic adaptor subunit [Noviherbaspirillum sp.]